MRTVVISVVGVVSVLLVIMTHTAINDESVYEEEVRTALTTAMNQTMEEVFEKNCYGIGDSNEMMAAFLQALLVKVGPDISLTVQFYECDKERGIMDVLATGEYKLSDDRRKKIYVRRKMKYMEQDREENKIETTN